MTAWKDRKYPPIDLLKLYSQSDNKEWNAFLTLAYEQQDVNSLAVIRYRIQAGMSDLAKNKLNSDEIVNWFLRLQRSIEITAKKILRLKSPNPNDSPHTRSKSTVDSYAEKKKRDHEFEQFLKQSAY